MALAEDIPGGKGNLPGIRQARPLRVLLVAHNLGENKHAGTENYVRHLGRALVEVGCEVTLTAPSGPPAQPDETIYWREKGLDGIPYLELTRTNPDLAGSVRHAGFEGALARMLGEVKADVVHFHHTLLTSISLLQVPGRMGLPGVLTLHDFWHLCPRIHPVTSQGVCPGPESMQKCARCLNPEAENQDPKELTRLTRFLLERQHYARRLLADCRVLAPSRFLRNLHYRYGIDAGSIIHWPLGLAPFTPEAATEADTDEGPPRLVFLGNLTQLKRWDLAVAAVGPLRGEARLEIWGQLIRPWGESFLKSLEGHEHISYRGPYRPEDLPRIFRGAWATLVPSDWENYPLVARESLMAGVPVVAARAGGIPEIVADGVNGLLFPAGDAKALQNRIQRLVRHPELRERLRRGIRPVKTIQEEAGELVDLYHTLINSKRGGVRGRGYDEGLGAGLKPAFN